MSDFDSVQNSEANPTEGSASPETQTSAEPQLQAGEQTPDNGQTDKPAPFHEHPRFKELVAQKNEYAQRMQTYERQLQEMQQRMLEFQGAQKAQTNNQPPSYREQVLKRLEDIDPEFAKFQKEMLEEASSAKELRQQLQEVNQWRQEMQLQQAQVKAQTRLSDLYSQHKVPDNMRPFYEAQIKAMAYENPNSRLSDIDQFFKNAHDNLSKFTEDLKRKERESYVSEKKKDAAPATQTGGQAPGTPKPPGASSKDEIKAILAQKLREGARPF